MKLFKNKDISPLGKLFILHLKSYPTYINYQLTSNEIRVELGATRCEVLEMLEELENQGYIETKKKPPIRITKLTKKAIELCQD
jgi:DNA-binding MarR family transcriptional regulator